MSDYDLKLELAEAKRETEFYKARLADSNRRIADLLNQIDVIDSAPSIKRALDFLEIELGAMKDLTLLHRGVIANLKELHRLSGGR